MEHRLSMDMVKVCELAAIESAKTMGFGDRKKSDKAAVEAMRTQLEKVDINGTIVIGEGERDKAPMLFIGEKVGKGKNNPDFPEIDIAVDPLEGTNLVATGSNNAITVLAGSEKGGLLYAPDIYLDKLVVGPSSAESVHIDMEVKDIIKAVAKALDRKVNDIVVSILDRERHHNLIEKVRQTDARIQLISDGDLSAGIAAVVRGSGIHIVMGSGGAPEGVLCAAALKCIGGQIYSRFLPKDASQKERLKSMGIDHDNVFTKETLAPGNNILFAATGVTNGSILKGVRFFGDGIRTNSILMTNLEHRIQFIDTIHFREKGKMPIWL
ncbi:MAG: class II fructose-bisphosphatase [Candidatus Coatesbacteria bacterium]|nr:class II fructose-bisphosphatase [Candidatus Coatesbacteria bacterium]